MQTVALREIRASSRRPITYWSRCAEAGAGAGIILFMMLQADFGFLNGRSLFLTAVTIAFLLCLLEGVRQASTAIVEERVDGTLGLLLLTRIRGGELLLGKFAALAFFSLQTLLAFTPVLAMSLLLGGISGGEMFRAALALATAIVSSITLGLVISAHSRQPARAMIATFLLLMFGAIILSLRAWPVTGWAGFIFQSINPMTPIWKISDFAYSQFRKEFWLSIFTTLAFSGGALWLTSRNLFARFAASEGEGSIQKFDPAGATPRTFTTVTAQKALTGARWFDGNPIEWLTLRHLGLRGRSYAPLCFAIFMSVVIFLSNFWGILMAFLLYLIFAFLYAVGATSTLARARQTGELELWLTTPLGYQAIIKGILAVMRKVFIWPGLILLISFLSIFYFRFLAPTLIQITLASPGMGGNQLWTFIYLFFTTLISMMAFLFAFPYVAMWIALKSKSPAQATIRTFLWMGICSWLVICIPKSLIFIPLGLVAAHSVRTTLKNFALQRAATHS